MTDTAVVPRRFGVRARTPALRNRRVNLVLVALLGLVTLVALFARLLAPDDPIQPIGDLNLPPGSGTR
jgi:peptide/nickel transport system permease protein